MTAEQRETSAPREVEAEGWSSREEQVLIPVPGSSALHGKRECVHPWLNSGSPDRRECHCHVVLVSGGVDLTSEGRAVWGAECSEDGMVLQPPNTGQIRARPFPGASG